jgi:hypothetical protein
MTSTDLLRIAREAQTPVTLLTARTGSNPMIRGNSSYPGPSLPLSLHIPYFVRRCQPLHLRSISQCLPTTFLTLQPETYSPSERSCPSIHPFASNCWYFTDGNLSSLPTQRIQQTRKTVCHQKSQLIKEPGTTKFARPIKPDIGNRYGNLYLNCDGITGATLCRRGTSRAPLHLTKNLPSPAKNH